MKSLETERLYLSMFTMEDAEDVFAYCSNPNVGPPAGWGPHKDVEESKEIIRDIFMPPEAWAIREKGSDTVIGAIALEPDRLRPDANSRELGYNLAEHLWGKGLMTEAAKEVLRFAFEELGLDQVGICTGPENKRSQRIIEKCGFKYEGTIRRTYKIYDGSLRDSLIFSMLKSEYEELY